MKLGMGLLNGLTVANSWKNAVNPAAVGMFNLFDGTATRTNYCQISLAIQFSGNPMR